MSAELALIVMVAVIVFGPNKLPMLATHLGRIIRNYYHFKELLHNVLRKLQNEVLLNENNRKAIAADEKYKNQP